MSSSLQNLPPFLLLLTAAVAAALLLSPANSQTCTSQTYSTNYENCTDLPTLKAFIHWTYNPTPNPTLSVAFTAAPAKPDGWVAWALNPTGTGMAGAQSLIAFKDSTNGSIVVKTYNISSYGPISESKIAYDVLNKSGEYSGGVFRIFATLAVPAAVGEGEMNQVWQVGASVKGGVPVKHDFSPENLGSKAAFDFVSRASAAATARGNGASATPGDGGLPAARGGGGNNSTSAGGGGRMRVLGLCGVLVPIGFSIFGF